MKKITLIIALGLSANCYGQDTIGKAIINRRGPAKYIIVTSTDSVNIKTIQDIVTFEPDLKKIYDGLIEVWYKQARVEGNDPKAAFKITLSNLSKQVNKL